VKLDSKVYVDLLEIMEHYEDEDERIWPQVFIPNFGIMQRQPERGPIRSQATKNTAA
jgi:hypothetical protein